MKFNIGEVISRNRNTLKGAEVAEVWGCVLICFSRLELR